MVDKALNISAREKKRNGRYDTIADTLGYFGVDHNLPYYVSSGQKARHYPHQPFRMDYYCFCMCTAGDMDILIDGHLYHAGENCLFIARPGTVIAFQGDQTDFRLKLLFFEREFLLKNISDPFIIDRLAFFGSRSYNLAYTGQCEINRLIERLNYIEAKSKANSRFRDEIIRTVIFNLLLEAAELLPEDQLTATDRQAKKPKDLYYQFLQLIEKQIYFHREVGYYAGLLHISNKYLISIVKRASGKTPHEIIDENLMKEAVVLLGNPAINISEVAYRLGFNSVSAFGRFFKKHTSVSPALYRKQQSLS